MQHLHGEISLIKASQGIMISITFISSGAGMAQHTLQCTCIEITECMISDFNVDQYYFLIFYTFSLQFQEVGRLDP